MDITIVRVTCEDHTMRKAFMLIQEEDLNHVVQDKDAVQIDLYDKVLMY